MKLIPGSREQRGTNFVRALRGQTPFCRPLKHAGAYLLLTAEVDELSHDKLHLAAQVGEGRALLLLLLLLLEGCKWCRLGALSAQTVAGLSRVSTALAALTCDS